MAGRIPQAFINDLVERADIVDVIDSRVPLKKTGKNHQALCPFHDEKTPSFTVSPDKGFYYCFGCGASGTALGFLMEFDRLDYVEAIETLAASLGLEVPRDASTRRSVDPGLYDVLARADQFYRKALRRDKDSASAVDYLKGRGVTGVTARDFSIGFAPPGWDALKNELGAALLDQAVQAGLLVRHEENGRVYDRFRDRIMFPIKDTKGRVIAFGGRVLKDEQPKYLNSPETPVFQKGRELYGLFEARRAVSRLDRLLVVEGYMDVVALAQHGITNAVATLGTATSGAHFEKLFRYAPEVVCCFDGDNAGRQAAWKALGNALPALTEGRALRFVFVPDGEDPDTLVRAQGRAHFERLVAESAHVGKYFFNHIGEGLDLTSMDNRARLCELAIPYLKKVPVGLYRRMMVERLAAMAEVSTAALEGQLGGIADPGRREAAMAPRRDTAMSKRLLSFLVHEPNLARRLDDSRLARLVAAVDDQTLFVRALRFLSSESAEPDSDVDAATLIARFVGDPGHEELVRLAQQPQPLGPDMVAVEFLDGVDRYLSVRSREQRRELVRELQEDGSNAQLARYWEVKKTPT